MIYIEYIQGYNDNSFPIYCVFCSPGSTLNNFHGYFKSLKWPCHVAFSKKKNLLKYSCLKYVSFCYTAKQSIYIFMYIYNFSYFSIMVYYKRVM